MLDKERESLQVQLDELERKINESSIRDYDVELLLRTLRDFRAAFTALTSPEQTEALQCVLEGVTVHPQKLALEIFELEESYKRECQETFFSVGSVPTLFCLGIQPNCLNVVSYSESGLLQAKGFALSPRARRRCDCSPVWFHFAVCDGAIVF